MSLIVPQDILQRLQDKSIINFDDHKSVFFCQTIKNLRFQSDNPVLHIFIQDICLLYGDNTVYIYSIFTQDILPRYSILFKILYQDILFIQDILSRFVGTDEDYIPRF